MTYKAHAMTFPQISFGKELVAGVRGAVPIVIFWDQKKKSSALRKRGVLVLSSSSSSFCRQA
eukprot:m.428763 g.428763  ORF g.428763 m.428763 type:complete len:62 (+) comp16874_c0_seq1:1141-1326(+)